MADLVIKVSEVTDCKFLKGVDANLRSSGSTVGGAGRDCEGLLKRHARQISKDIFGISPSHTMLNPIIDPDFLLLSKFKIRRLESIKGDASASRKTEEVYFNQMAEILGSSFFEEPMQREQVNYEDLQSIKDRYSEIGSLKYQVFPSEETINRKIESITWTLLDRIVNKATPIDIMDYIQCRPPGLINFKMRFEFGRSLLIYAVLRGDPGIVKTIITKEQDLVCLPDDRGLTPLHYAVFYNQPALISLLMDYGADVDQLDNDLRTAMHIAAIKNLMDCYLMLKARDSSGRLADKFGLRPVQYFSDKSMQSLVTMLEKGLLKEKSSRSFAESFCQSPSKEVSRESTFTLLKVHLDMKAKRFLNRKLTLFSRLNLNATNQLKVNQSSKEYYRDYYREHLDRCYYQQLLKRESVNSLSREFSDSEENHNHESSEDSDASSGIEIPSKHTISHKDFIIHDKIGKGSFGEIQCVSIRGIDKKFAMKSLTKNSVARRNLLRLITAEKKVMANFVHPFMVGLHHSFQTRSKLYMVMDYCEKQDMGKYIRQNGTLTEHQAKILMCELILAIKAMHSKNFIHRDIKVDNIFVDSDGHVKLGDFGLTKELKSSRCQTDSFCGSIAYLPPEIVKRKTHGKSVDWYLLGELLYELILGRPPFYAENKMEIQEAILFKDIYLPTNISPNLKDLISGLLLRNPESRLGSKFGAQEVMDHSFFIGIDWEKVIKKEYSLFDPFKIRSYPLRQLNLHVKDAKVSTEKTISLPFWNYSRPAVSDI
jgi:tRNA A-37 threonylcarbamoyl transferase component Bud32